MHCDEGKDKCFRYQRLLIEGKEESVTLCAFSNS